MTKRRNSCLDMMKGIAAIFVVFIHVMGSTIFLYGIRIFCLRCRQKEVKELH